MDQEIFSYFYELFNLQSFPGGFVAGEFLFCIQAIESDFIGAELFHI